MTTVDDRLPGADLVQRGLDDLAAQTLSDEALLVVAAAPRLQSAGIEVPELDVDSPLHVLYHRLALGDSDTAHERYNALVRRVVKFANAADLHARAG